ncbi:hypothetical protein [Bacillus kexueae]|uniref:hypothetical protein n=1 Tax=Aeribacillus kexueae TaxID=2078952 RepID=UPI001FAFF4DC|nr:hypothetical protein [Bacillus kexueae]
MKRFLLVFLEMFFINLTINFSVLVGITVRILYVAVFIYEKNTKTFERFSAFDHDA